MRIIPAIDLIDGKCVRLTQGDYTQKKIYNEDPLEVAKQFEDNGFKYLHLVDLDGAKSQSIVNTKTLENITGKTSLKVDFGGGIKTDEAIRIAFACGASQVTGGSVALKNKPLFLSWLQEFGPEKIILGADVKGENIAVNGWLENSTSNLFDFLDGYINEGIRYVVCTDIHKDGLLQGCSLSLYQKIIQNYKDLKLIASGGVSSINELEQLKDMGLDGVIIGKALYENKISIKELQPYVD